VSRLGERAGARHPPGAGLDSDSWSRPASVVSRPSSPIPSRHPWCALSLRSPRPARAFGRVGPAPRLPRGSVDRAALLDLARRPPCVPPVHTPGHWLALGIQTTAASPRGPSARLACAAQRTGVRAVRSPSVSRPCSESGASASHACEAFLALCCLVQDTPHSGTIASTGPVVLYVFPYSTGGQWTRVFSRPPDLSPVRGVVS